MEAVRLVLRPLGHVVFLFANVALSAASLLLGEEHELGFFAGRLSRSMRSYPEITRRGREITWCVWAILLLVAASPFDPLATPWDEVALGAAGALVLSLRFVVARRGGR